MRIELVTENALVKTDNSKICGLTVDDFKINIYKKSGRTGIDIFQKDKTKSYNHYRSIYSEWLD